MARKGERESDVQMRKKKAQAESRPESLKFTNQMQKSNLYRAYSLRDDTNSDFTVLDLHKDEEEGFQNIGVGTDGNPVRMGGGSAPCSRDLQSTHSSSASSENPSNSSHRDTIDSNLHHSLETTVAKLDSLLQQEPNLAHRSEIFRYMDTIKSMVGKPASPPCQNGNGSGMQVRNTSMFMY